MTFILYSCNDNDRGFNLRKVEANLSESKTKFFTEKENIKNVTGKLGKKNK